MNKERLKEIKDSIDFQYEIVEAQGYCKECNDLINEELELYNEVIRLREELKHYEETTTFGDYVKEVNLLVDYKARIDKAINKIQYIRDLGFDYDGFNNVEDLKGLIDTLVDIAGQSINILRGNDE